LQQKNLDPVRNGIFNGVDRKEVAA
jgi:hypothetical protein